MDRIILDRKIEIGKEVLIQGPLLEALLFQGGRIGSLVTLTGPDGKDFRGRVSHLSKTEALIFVFDVFPFPTESSIEIILLQALPEKERMEWIIQKATELGVSTILPFKSKKSVSLEEREAKQKKAHRWQHIAVHAVQQSRRARVPLVGEYGSFEKTLGECQDEGLKIFLWEKKGDSLKEVLKRFSESNPPSIKGKKIYLVVGPEGGFTEDEVRLAMGQGFIPVKLGQRILRTETAAITLIGIIQYELGDLG